LRELRFRRELHLALAQLNKDVSSYMELAYLPKESSTNATFTLNTKKFSIGPVATEATSVATTSELAPKITEYTVQFGDTLSRIAKESGMTITELALLNNIGDMNKIKVGQVIKFRGEKIVTPTVKVATNVSRDSKNNNNNTSNSNNASTNPTETPVTKTNAERLKQATVELKKASDTLTRVKYTGENGLELAQKQFDDANAKVVDLGVKFNEEQRVAKIEEDYNNLSDNKKNLKDYIKKYDTLIATLPKGYMLYSQGNDPRVDKQITQLQKNINDCNSLIKNDQKITDLGKKLELKYASFNLRTPQLQAQAYPFKTEIQNQIRALDENNKVLLDQLEKSSITPTMLAKDRNSKQSPTKTA
ncbi:LysM peptidoglycan-binding domain-containing protein, partial [Candidatus Gracilibacteria bacterium]|nr:LysM peptidoglycan-binding domain-containing protein [Candidatus Gracilibacteria bacterium]